MIQIILSSVQFKPLTDWVVRGDMREVQQKPSSSFLQEAIVSSYGTGRDLSLFDVVHPAVPLSTTALPILQGALKDGFGEAVVACDKPEPCKSPSL